MFRRPTLALPALLAVVGLALAGCSASSGDVAATSADTIRTTIDIPSGFDPTLTQSLPDFVLARTSYDTLVRRDASGLVAGLASKWTATPTEAVFTIRKGATCSDGTTITPTVVKNSLDYFARPGSAATEPVYVFGPGNTPKIVADDAAGTVTVSLTQPWPYLVDGMSISSTGIICPKGLANPKALQAGKAKGSESGPYVLKSSQPGVRYEYSLRKDYDSWPKWTTDITGKPAKNLIYTVSQDPTATANLILTGQLDIGKIQAQTMTRFKGQTGYKVSVNRFSDMYLVFNERDGSPFTSEAARKGVVQAIDRAMFVKVTSLNTGELVTSLAAKKTECVPSTNDAIPSQDVAAAKAALKGLTIRLTGPTIVGANGAGNEYIADALRAAGATVKLDNSDIGTWVSNVLTKPDSWDITVYADLNFLGSLASPLMNFTGPTLTGGGSNIGEVQNSAAEAAFSAANSATNPATRCEQLRSAVDALITRSDALPLDNDPYIYASRPGFSVQMLGGALDDPIFRITG
jgi:peptide/nickel transport system substrate-binding protein